MKNLIKFCHKHNVYDKVYYNTKHIRVFAPISFGQVLKGIDKANRYFAVGFTWMETKEGYDYWRNISDKWKDYCQVNRIEFLHNENFS